MEAIVAFSLVASIFQVVQFSLSLFSHSNDLHQSGQNVLREITSVDLIIINLVKRIDFMRVSATFEEQRVDASLKSLYESCLATSEELLMILRKFRSRTDGKIRVSFKRSMLALGSKEKINGLVKRLEAIRQEIHFCIAVSTKDQILHHTQKLQIVDGKVQKVLDQMEHRPKELGFPWETGIPKDQVKIDGGLGAEYLLPVELCKTPEAFFDFLKFKFTSQNLPGLPQVQQGHVLLWEWNERHVVSRESWSNVVEGDRAIKLSFVMCNWQGPPRNRCMRCSKPRTYSAYRSLFKPCHSCKLAVQWVAPEYLPFEPTDIAIIDQNTYRDYQVALRRPQVQHQSLIQDASTIPVSGRREDNEPPSIDLVSHRITMKWEPIHNMVFRYLFCRCIIRLSTPSRLNAEMTLFHACVCPRHNTQGITFRDYSELALPRHADPYFDKFGGYNAFWALLHCYRPKIYDNLSGPQAITSNQLEYGYVDLARIKEHDKDAVWRMLKDYQFEVTEHLVNRGIDLPPDHAADFAKEKAERQSVEEKTFFEFSPSEEWITNMRNSPMYKELKEIIEGNWDGIPHWIIED